MGKRKVYLVIQNAWDTEYLTMPLALGYLKAYALADPVVAESFDIRIFNFCRRVSVSEMAQILFIDPPDVLGFSVLGWNFRNSGYLAETFRQVRPDGWCVFGGNHVSHQAERTFRLFPTVDVIVNGEGEHAFREILLARLADEPRDALARVAGISHRCPDAGLQTNPDRPRIADLDCIPSPFLTGAIPLRGPDGRFLYDVALMETNRGCPYQCAFCYWGGATGQKVHAFSVDRLREELEFFAHHRIENLCLCDANFAIRKQDLEFVDALIDVNRRTGYPKNFVTSWAKNKSKTFYEIVRVLKDHGLHTDFTLSLQTLSDVALEEMQRRNMKLNDFEDLCEWLESEGMGAHAELIWGAPGETRESFMDGYDRVARYIPRVATYPLCLLPNTRYYEQRDRYALVTVRDSASDYEFILSHSTISLEDNRQMHRFLFWARLAAEYQVFRACWRPLNRLAGLKQSSVLMSLDAWFQRQPEPVVAGLLEYQRSVVEGMDITRVPAAAIYTYLHTHELEPVFRRWWMEEVVPHVKPEHSDFFEALFEWDWITRPYYDAVAERDGAEIVDVDGTAYYVRRGLAFSCDVPAALCSLREGGLPTSLERVEGIALYYQTGFSHVADSHEFVPRYVGRTRAQTEAEAELRRQGKLTRTVQPHVVGHSTASA